MLAGTGFGDNPGLAHALREQDLPDAIVDLVRAGVIELVALEPHLCTAQRLGQPFGEIERRRTPDIVLHQVVEFGLELWIGLRRAVFSLEIQDQRHQRFGDIAPAEFAKVAAIVGLGAEGIG